MIIDTSLAGSSIALILLLDGSSFQVILAVPCAPQFCEDIRAQVRISL